MRELKRTDSEADEEECGEESRRHRFTYVIIPSHGQAPCGFYSAIVCCDNASTTWLSRCCYERRTRGDATASAHPTRRP